MQQRFHSSHLCGIASLPGRLRQRRMSDLTPQSRFRLLAGRQPGASAVVEYGSPSAAGAAACVPLTPLGELTGESWFLPDAVVARSGNFQLSEGETLLLAAAAFDAQQTLEDLTAGAYDELLSLVRSRGLHLNRVWNYVRGINDEDGGLERYRRFSIGRYEAFRKAGFRLSDDLPAASAVGTHEGPQLTIIALAGQEPGRHVENPRQVSAYAYPETYGPRSPSFSRATLVETGGLARLWISGTASIVGHQTLHGGDTSAQLDETILNLSAVLESGGFSEGLETVRMMKVYLRNRDDAAKIRERMRQLFGREVPTIWLRADICRKDLLIEIEALAERPSLES